MSNDTKNRILIEHLKNDRSTELMPHDLNKMLDQELAKPAEEIDAQLVRDLLDLLEEKSPSKESKDECWKAIQMQTQKNNRCKRNTFFRRMSTAAAVLLAIFFVSYGTAQAFNWASLLKLLSPVAQTFGIYSANNPINPPDASDGHEYVDEDTEYEQVNYSRLEDMPTQLKGYKIVPAWIPERFTFATGSIYEDPTIAIASIFFNGNDEYLTLSLSFYEEDEDTIAHVYEAYTDDERSLQIADQSVTYYHNDSGEIQAASAIAQNVHLYIGGNISEYELEQIIASMH